MVFAKSYEEGQIVHFSFPLVKTALEHELLTKLLTNYIKKTMFFERIDLQRRIEKIVKKIERYIEQILPEVHVETRKNISMIVGHNCSVLGPFFPLFLDEKVEDIYLDRPEQNVYFDHQDWGRCKSLIKICKDDIAKIITLLRLESNFHFDKKNPSIKTAIKLLDKIRLRFSASISPLASDEFHLEIRRARNTPFNLQDLIKNKTLSVDAAALLVLGFTARFNITITGEPGSGKTTLLNALDLCAPQIWRKLYIEDVIESRVDYKSHQIRLRVTPFDEDGASLNKMNEIIKSLHRAPDYLILGEIQTAEHSQALFQALVGGLHSIQTCHSSSAEALISRWQYSHNIRPESIALMDLIVTMQRIAPGNSRRIVKEIFEIQRLRKSGLLVFTGINKIYSEQEGIRVENWSENGAIKDRAREIGTKNPEMSFNSVIKLLKFYDNNDGIRIGDILWKRGHPLGFRM